MKRLLPAGLALIAMTIMFDTAASAQGLAPGNVATPHSVYRTDALVIQAGMRSLRRKSRQFRRFRRTAPHGSQGFTIGQQQPTANTGAALHALNVIIQFKQKCRNALVPPPECL